MELQDSQLMRNASVSGETWLSAMSRRLSVCSCILRLLLPGLLKPIRFFQYLLSILAFTGGGSREEVNPMKRVAPLEFADTHDAEKYTEMLLEAAESVLGVFGFSRTQLGFQRRPKSFLEELRGEKEKEIRFELESLENPAVSRQQITW